MCQVRQISSPTPSVPGNVKKKAHLVNLTDMLLTATKINNMLQSIRLSILIWTPKKQNVALPDSYICRLACLFVWACHAFHPEGLGVGQATNKNTVLGSNETWTYYALEPSMCVCVCVLGGGGGGGAQAHSWPGSKPTSCSNPLNQKAPFYYIWYWSKRPLDQNGLNQNGLYSNNPWPKQPLVLNGP